MTDLDVEKQTSIWVPKSDDTLTLAIIEEARERAGSVIGTAELAVFAEALIAVMDAQTDRQRVIHFHQGGGWRASDQGDRLWALHSFPLGARVRFTEDARSTFPTTRNRVAGDGHVADGMWHTVTGYPNSLHDVTLDNNDTGWSETWLTWRDADERKFWRGDD